MAGSMATQRIEVITGSGVRRRYSDEEKLRLVEEAFGPGASVMEVARREGVDQSLVRATSAPSFSAARSVDSFRLV